MRLADALTAAERRFVYGGKDELPCQACAGKIEDALADLGSILCHDCRVPGR